MAPAVSSTPRNINTRGRFTRNSSQRASSDERHPVTEPPLKKRRYIPGGPGGGGRYIAAAEKAPSIRLENLDGLVASEPRPRAVRELTINGIQSVPSPRPRRESRRDKMSARPRFSSAAAAAAAVAHGDGFKPREERGWEEFHEDLNIDSTFPVFSSLEVDGVSSLSRKDTETQQVVHHQQSEDDTMAGVNSDVHMTSLTLGEVYSSGSPTTTPRRRPGRPPRRPDALLKGIGISPDTPRIIPPPGFNPREKLTLPKPSFHPIDPFDRFTDREQFVDQTMSNVGYQESESWIRSPTLILVTEGNIEDDLVLKTKNNDKDDGTGIGPAGVGRVEYDMDEQDTHWLNALNEARRKDDVHEIKPWLFEVVMTKVEKEWYALEKRIPKPNPKPPQTHRPRSSSAAAVNGELAPHGEEQDSKCAICDDGDCENTNAIVFCDGCDLAVHQECYGVPFIPEGQWLCRKCQLIGRGTPTCIFCPNTDGAFKQTNASRWSHLLCAIWIPEVSIGNATFMEPVMEVEKVPKQRWKLTCYICRQKMGACIQCGNKNCYIAFHVSCARRARLFLKMKSTHGGPASLDASVLKAFCDKHVPADWRREHDVDHAIVEAMDYYRYTMRGRLWADSQQAALTAIPPPPQDPMMEIANGEQPSNPKITLKFGTKATANQTQTQTRKPVWKLPSGAPVIPQALFNSVENSLQRFAVRKRKEFAAEVCKYWTLKREARRGAALLKRLQLQMETFTSMEIPRRNFVGMGAAGGVRLQRRIDFAETLLEDVDKLRELCSKVTERERQKLEDAKALKDIIETIYFPLKPLFFPVLEKASMVDKAGFFESGFLEISHKVDKGAYNTVLDFTTDLAAAIGKIVCRASLDDRTDIVDQSSSLSPSKAKLNPTKNKEAAAKKMIKAIQGLLEEATRRESELSRTEVEANVRRIDAVLNDSLAARQTSLSTVKESDKENLQVNGLVNGMDLNSKVADTPGHLLETPSRSRTSLRGSLRRRRTNTSNGGHPLVNGNSTPSSTTGPVGNHHVSQSSELSDTDSGTRQSPLSGGVPWYMASFNISGTSIEDEQVTLTPDAEVSNDMDNEQNSKMTNGNSQEKLNGNEGGGASVRVSAPSRKKATPRKRRRG